MVEDENSDMAHDDSKEEIGSMAMIVGGFGRECVARAKGLANEVKYHKVEVTGEEINR